MAPAALWPWPIAALALGSLFLLSVTAGALYAVIGPARESSASDSQEFARVRITQAAPKQKAVLPVVKSQAKATPKTIVAPSPPATTAETADTSVSVGPPAASDGAGSSEMVEAVKTDAALPNEPPQKSVQEVAAKEQGETCSPAAGKGTGDFCGTAVTFVASPRVAEEEALKQQKLVFVLHVSGNFEDPGFT